MFSLKNVLGLQTRGFSTGLSVNEKMWRLPFFPPAAVWPNYKDNYTHRRHRTNIFYNTYGVQKQSTMKCVDNSALSRQSQAMGRPAMIIQVYSEKHKHRPHEAQGKLGDRVLCAVMGQKKKGIIVGLKAKQLHGIPRFDSNNVVLIEENGNPSGTRITAPLPNVIRPILKRDSNPKKADYTKLLAIASNWI
ncbi:39S ribosomal protein L14, mitochondrial [Eurytemora carolleeae]|uniref:39S ribosomal protein L14, mitochondrial n=1 Tax=Eurytemora carolleeae TaxID=1294199 RepID=UPI000C790B65|nr:39S ribosomal protein L14, mitochondrial [Eurytemora carolleeae]|eukprot:XP_023332516.1 39S ribosomal protein L14, mitochondrial-like [Eurytemora affinis]